MADYLHDKMKESVIDYRFMDAIADPQSHRQLKVPQLHLILLNFNLMPSTLLLKFMTHAKTITCADGGSKRFLSRLDGMNSQEQEEAKVICEKLASNRNLAVVGDMDSFDDTLKQRLISMKFQIRSEPEQYSTDAVKCLRWLSEESRVDETDFIIFDGSFGGRFDHNISIINSLYTRDKPVVQSSESALIFNECAPPKLLDVPILLLGSESLCCLIPEGKTTLFCANEFCGKTCGILPFIPTSGISTKGLVWNLLPAWECGMRGIMSSCNQRESDIVEISTPESLIWFSHLVLY